MGFATSIGELMMLVGREYDLEQDSIFLKSKIAYLGNQVSALTFQQNTNPNSAISKAIHAQIRSLSATEKLLEMKSHIIDKQLKGVQAQRQAANQRADRGAKTFGLGGGQQ